LLRLLDQECAPEERARLERHLAACEACTTRHATLSRLGGAVTAALAAADEEGRATRRRTARPARVVLRAAVVVLVLVGGVAVASAQPIRAWLRARWSDLRGIALPPGDGAPSIDTAGATTVRFVPTTSVFAIELDTHQHEGSLTIGVSRDTIAVATVRPGTLGEELIVLPTGLRIVNRPDGRSSYDVRLPHGVAEIRLRIAGAPERRLVPAPDERMWTIDLKQRNP
jgi:hypothetical protein